MNVEEKNILFLDNAIDLPYQKRAKILKMFDIDTDLFASYKEVRQKISAILTPKELNSLDNSATKPIEKVLKQYELDGVTPITIYSPYYPELLKEGVEPPFCLYCKGDINLLKTECIAIVGSRKITEYGKVITTEFAREFIKANLTVVSGLAMGVDAIAHSVALENKGNTIAVMAGGFKHIYPQSNYWLYEDICKNGLVVTEYVPDAEPMAYNFPVRNRIIAGLSRGVLVTEAGAKSGALHTKNYAIDSGRDVFAIPGKITSPESEGTNNIIKQCQASLVTSPSDIFNALGISLKEKEENITQQLDIMASTILNYILVEKKTFQEIADFTKLSTRELNNKLLEMQMEGLIIKLAGNSYISCK